MDKIRIDGFVDHKHRLSADVPGSVPQGPVTVWIAPSLNEDDAGDAWVNGIVREWADDLSDVRQDIYTMSDGEAVDQA
jgi:hypothetical protein